MGEIKHKSVGSLQKGNYVIMDGAACIVTDLKTSRPGKHGHAKVNMTAVGMIDGKKRNTVMPGHDNVETPVIDKKNAQVLSVTGNTANVMDMESYETFDVVIPPDMEGQVQNGVTIVYWVVLNDKILKQIKSE
ncbi:MAG: translation initiation factor IF-5A [archaeon]